MLANLPNQYYTTIDEFTLESEEVLTKATVAFTIQGQLNVCSNVILVCHALSGSADVMDWWSGLGAHSSRPALDLKQFCIIRCNSLASPYGSSSPLSIQAGNSSSYGGAFPKTTIRDDQ